MADQKRKEEGGLFAQYGGQDTSSYGGLKFNFKSDLSRYGGPDIGAYGGQGIAEYGNLPKPPEEGDETNGTVKRLLDKILKMKRGRL